MRKTIFILLISFLVISMQMNCAIIYTKKGTLDISLSNIRNNNGNIYIFIYSFENQYPYEPYKHYKVSKFLVKNGVITARIPNLEFKDKYAITVIDDENSNEDLDRWLGIPHEGYGFSNNIKPFLSLPTYTDITFDFLSPKKLNVKLQYIL
jgi:uncharacterized protein (DUF2141 family)